MYKLRYCVRNDRDTVVDLVRVGPKKAQSLVTGKASKFFTRKLQPDVNQHGLTFEVVGAGADSCIWQNLISSQLKRLKAANGKKTTRAKITPEVISSVMNLHDLGHKTSAIVRRAGISTQSVLRILKQNSST